MWGLSPSDNNAQIIAFKTTHGLTHPAAGTEGGAPAAINVVTSGQTFLGYPTWCVICPDKSMYFDVCWPPGSAACFDPYIQNCVDMGLTAGFTADFTEVCQYNDVQFSDQSNGSVTSWNWTFEGGNPAVSTLQNPVVTYNDVGIFDVTLQVSDGTNSNTVVLEDYMEVLLTPPVMLLPFSDVCEGTPPFELTGGSPADGVYSGPGVEDGWFDPAVAGLGSHVIQYTYAALNDCENTAQETILVDPCTGIDFFGQDEIWIYPNPAKEKVNISMNHSGPVAISVSTILGLTVINENYEPIGKFNVSIDFGHLREGIYFLSIKTSTGTLVNKVYIQK